MTRDDDLVPIFIPPLAALLAQAEELKGSRLAESEVVRIRDAAVCMMLSKERAEQMSESRGYRDVNPENCWADWHRLRVQMTGKGYSPRIVLCLLGNADYAERCKPILEEAGVTHEFSGHDERMVQAFEASASHVHPSLEEGDFVRIAGHATVLYVLSDNFSAQEGPDVSCAFLRLGRRLLQAGAFALKCESSGIAHAPSRWIGLADRVETGHASYESMQALFLAYVQMPIRGGDDLYTCGMHLLGKPDLIVSESLLQHAMKTNEPPIPAAVDLFHTFAMYLLAECPEGEFASGHTFRSDSQSPRFRVAWEECTGYDENDFFFNPFGRWRFSATK